jgi:uncharacterized protein YjbI with pentapeptide repeats
MNEEHYQKVKRVLERTADAMAGMLRQTNLEGGDAVLAAIPQLLRPGRDLWLAELPADQGFGVQERLDLSGADLSGGLFIAMPGYGGLNGANLRAARLDNTIWFIHLKHADLSGASFRNASLVMLACEGSVFHGADFSGAQAQFLVGEHDPPADFTDANFSGATLHISGPSALIMAGCRMDGCRVIGKTESGPQAAYYKRGLDQFLASLAEEQRSQIVLGDRTGQAGGPSGESKCFVATAACGSDRAADVLALRQFRDVVLRGCMLGRAFIGTYETLSPPLARLIERSPRAQRVARRCVVQPATHVARFVLGAVCEDDSGRED